MFICERSSTVTHEYNVDEKKTEWLYVCVSVYIQMLSKLLIWNH